MTTISDSDGVEVLALPDMESGDDYPRLAAWFAGFSLFENYRKVILSQCRELERAKRALTGEKTTEARLDDLAHIHPAYLGYLAEGLRGKEKYAICHLKQGGVP